MEELMAKNIGRAKFVKKERLERAWSTKIRNTRKRSTYRDSAQTESLFYFSHIHHKTSKAQGKTTGFACSSSLN